MAHTLNNNYKQNVEILKENLKRGLAPSKAVEVIKGWHKQFTSHNLYGDEEKAFLNECLKVVEPYTHINVVLG